MDEKNLERVEAFLDAVTYKFRMESNAEIIQLGPITGIRYLQYLDQPWPRSFKYRLEFYVFDSPPVDVHHTIQVHLQDGPEEYVLNVFSSNLAVQIPAYKDLGYQHAWNNVLMEHKLSPSSYKVTPNPQVLVRKVKDKQDISSINALDPDYLSSIRGLDCESIHNLLAEYNGEISAKAQIITRNPRFAYLSDMFTHPDFRRKGISARLLQEMHATAFKAGAAHTLLVPSRMTREIELYQKYNYREVLPIALLVPPAC